MYMYVYIYIHIYICMYVCVCVCTYMYVCVYIYIYTYIHMHIHICIHIYIYTLRETDKKRWDTIVLYVFEHSDMFPFFLFTEGFLKTTRRDGTWRLHSFIYIVIEFYGFRSQTSACDLFSFDRPTSWYAPSPRHLRSLLSKGGWFFVWSFVVLFLSCVCVCDLFILLQALSRPRDLDVVKWRGWFLRVIVCNVVLVVCLCVTIQFIRMKTIVLPRSRARRCRERGLRWGARFSIAPLTHSPLPEPPGSPTTPRCCIAHSVPYRSQRTVSTPFSSVRVTYFPCCRVNRSGLTREKGGLTEGYPNPRVIGLTPRWDKAERERAREGGGGGGNKWIFSVPSVSEGLLKGALCA